MARPSRIARIASTVSTPALGGAAKPNSVAERRRPGRRVLDDAHRAVALHVGVPAHRAQPGAGPADHAAQQRTLTISRMVGDRVACWVSPIAQQTIVAGDVGEELRRGLDLGPGQPGRRARPAPSRRSRGPPRRRRSPSVYRSTKSLVDGARTATQQRSDRLEQRQVAADPDLQEVDRPARCRRRPRRVTVCGLRNRISPASGSGLTATIVAPLRLASLQRGQHARVVRARVLADDDEQFGVVDVVERDAALADADRLGQRQPRRLVAHVRAVGQVVGAERAGEQLVEERGLVGRAARGVEDRLVRGWPGPRRRRGDQRERVVPGDRLVVVRPRPRRTIGSVSRPCWPSQWSERAASSPIECSAKNSASIRRSVASSATALAPFSQNSACDALPGRRLGPRAARAVEAVDLVDPQQGQRAPAHAHLVQPGGEPRDHAGHPGRRRASAGVTPQVTVADVIARSLLRHASIVGRTAPAGPADSDPWRRGLGTLGAVWERRARPRVQPGRRRASGSTSPSTLGLGRLRAAHRSHLDPARRTGPGEPPPGTGTPPAPCSPPVVVVALPPGWADRDRRATVFASTTVAAPAPSRRPGSGRVAEADRAQDEVMVIEDGGRRLARDRHAVPDPGRDRGADRSRPPAGLPARTSRRWRCSACRARSTPHAGWWSDARVWFLLVTVATLALAFRLLLRRRLGRTGSGRAAMLVRAVQVVRRRCRCAHSDAATGGDDLPVLALCLLAFTLAATESGGVAAQPRDRRGAGDRRGGLAQAVRVAGGRGPGRVLPGPSRSAGRRTLPRVRRRPAGAHALARAAAGPRRLWSRTSSRSRSGAAWYPAPQPRRCPVTSSRPMFPAGTPSPPRSCSPPSWSPPSCSYGDHRGPPQRRARSPAGRCSPRCCCCPRPASATCCTRSRAAGAAALRTLRNLAPHHRGHRATDSNPPPCVRRWPGPAADGHLERLTAVAARDAVPDRSRSRRHAPGRPARGCVDRGVDQRRWRTPGSTARPPRPPR